MIYQTVNRCDFADAFIAMNRKDNFSHKGLNTLYEYFEELSEIQDIELDVIAICCEFTEYFDINEYNEYYDTDYSDIEEIEHFVLDNGDGSFIVNE